LPKIRAVQHKPRNEERKAKEIVDLKQENHSLKRKLKRLQKEVRKREPPEAEEEMIEPTTEKCPECGTQIRELDLAGKRYRICGDCKWRQKA
jgi:uncharacterized protein YlxW (UPF0749 family)